MQKTVLIANIGNSNLKVKRPNTNEWELIPDLLKQGVLKDSAGNVYPSFRDYTLAMLAELEADARPITDFQLNILNSWLAYLSKEDRIQAVEKVVLFTSDQRYSSDMQGKDTHFAGKIVKRLIAHHFESLKDKIEINTIETNIINPDGLIITYKEKLQALQQDEFQYLFCYEGGTPQQNVACKIVAEYFFLPDSYVFYNVIEQPNGSSEVTEMSKYEYKKIIDKQQIEQLIKVGAYHSAAKLSQGKAQEVLILIGNRFDRRLKPIDTVLENKINTHKTNFPTLAKYFATHPHYIAWQNTLKEEPYRDLCELFWIAEFYRHLED